MIYIKEIQEKTRKGLGHWMRFGFPEWNGELLQCSKHGSEVDDSNFHRMFCLLCWGQGGEWAHCKSPGDRRGGPGPGADSRSGGEGVQLEIEAFPTSWPRAVFEKQLFYVKTLHKGLSPHVLE